MAGFLQDESSECILPEMMMVISSGAARSKGYPWKTEFRGKVSFCQSAVRQSDLGFATLEEVKMLPCQGVCFIGGKHEINTNIVQSFCSTRFPGHSRLELGSE